MNTPMMFFRTLLCLIAIAVAGSFFTACEEEPPASLYDPGRVGGPTPTIASVAPNDSALAGVSTVIITGTNFSTTPANNLVFFNASPATVLQATTTQLTVRAPVLIKDSISIKVSVLGSELFSNVLQYKLVAAVVEFGMVPTVEDPQGIACNARGDVFVSLLSTSNSGLGVKKVTPVGVRTNYAAPFSTSINKWTSMKVGPGDTIYAAANRNAIFILIPLGPDTARSAPWANVGPAGTTSVYDFDFDAQKNIWVGGSNSAIYRVRRSDRNVKTFSFAGEARAVRVYNGYLYIGGQTSSDSREKIVRFQIVSADSLGPQETYFDFTAAYNGPAVYAVTFANDGDMFVGTDSLAGSIVLVHPNLSSEPFYPGLLSGKSVSFGYGTGTELYVSRTGNSNAEKRVIRINTQKLGAPYYGRQ